MNREVVISYNTQTQLRELMQIYKTIPSLSVLKGKRRWNVDWSPLTAYVYGSETDYIESDYISN